MTVTRDEETLFLRFLQEADAETLRQHLRLRERTRTKTGLRFDFSVQAEKDSGYLWIVIDEETDDVLTAEMDVGFPSMIGLNRSPLELRILCEHVMPVFRKDLAQDTADDDSAKNENC